MCQCLPAQVLDAPSSRQVQPVLNLRLDHTCLRCEHAFLLFSLSEGSFCCGFRAVSCSAGQWNLAAAVSQTSQVFRCFGHPTNAVLLHRHTAKMLGWLLPSVCPAHKLEVIHQPRSMLVGRVCRRIIHLRDAGCGTGHSRNRCPSFISAVLTVRHLLATSNERPFVSSFWVKKKKKEKEKEKIILK